MLCYLNFDYSFGIYKVHSKYNFTFFFFFLVIPKVAGIYFIHLMLL